VHWEYWTASNGSHFHNPDLALESINKGMGISQAGIKMLDEAMAKRRAASRLATAPVAAATPATAVK
jgi:nitrite reductase (cytochrome c-552)